MVTLDFYRGAFCKSLREGWWGGGGLSLTLNIKTCNFFFLFAHNSFREEKPQEGAWKESVVVELRCLTGPGP